MVLSKANPFCLGDGRGMVVSDTVFMINTYCETLDFINIA